jgi:hypothetical protein
VQDYVDKQRTAVAVVATVGAAEARAPAAPRARARA